MNRALEVTRRTSLRDLLLIIFTKLHVFLGIFAFIVIATVGFALLKEPVYEVTADVLIKPQLEENLKLQAPVTTSMRANPVTQQDINSEVNLLKSPQLLEQVVKKLGLDKEGKPKSLLDQIGRFLSEHLHRFLVAWGLSKETNPVDQAVRYYQQKLEIKPITLSNSIEITLRGEDPEQIAKIVNTLLASYIDYHIDIYKAKGAQEFYARQAEQFGVSLAQAEKDLEEFKKKWDIIDLTAQNEANVKILQILKENLALVQAQIKERQAKVGEQEINLAQTGEIGAATKEFQTGILEELIRTLGPLMAEKERISLHYRKSSPKYQAAELQVKELLKVYQKKTAEILRGSQLDLKGLRDYARGIQRDIDRIKDSSVSLSQRQVELDRLTRDIKQLEKNYLLYLDKTEEARIEAQQEANRVSNVAVTNWARPPSIPVFPRKILMTVLSVFIGLMVGLAGGSVSYYADHTLKIPEDLPRLSKIPVLAGVELVDNMNGGSPAGGPPLWMKHPQDYPSLVGSFRSLKYNLALLKKSEGRKIISITGSDPQVGVTTVAANLAAIMAWDFCDQRILLIDANLDHPQLHATFGKSPEPGLLEHLIDQLPVTTIIQPTFLPNLDLVALGQQAKRVASPFDLQRFSEFLEEVREKYDFVILDTAPILRASDSLIISGKVDGVVAVAGANQTRYEVMLEAGRQIEKIGKLEGGVLNKRRFVIPRALYRFL
jgi:succinoglycan biosynthesis transport protein ExoP|uniref:non-specific protein-tyrosine kinase n=1 Tax=Desulfobacca acetoxidans TaxID=60893 RepID=A0A7V6DPU3_9BACT